MADMEAALAVLEGPNPPPIAKVAREFNINRSTLSRRFHGKTRSTTQAREDRQLLTPRQEKELVKYIYRLCERCLPPTPKMVHNFVVETSKQSAGHNWVNRFVKRQQDELDSRFLNCLDIARHQADYYANYESYFSIIQRQFERFNITPGNVYNLDEKGFAIGLLQKSQRIFPRALYKRGQLIATGQDGSREWITVLAAICADGTAISPSLIYKAVKGVTDTWVEAWDPALQRCNFASTANGWTDNIRGLNWLETVFEPETREEAGRSWRVLFLDGHGSHVRKKFIETAYRHRILLAVYPPHSTHRLKPLDVGCFAPLAQYYSQRLDEHIRRTEGFSSVTKRNFFELFWPAWNQAFSTTNINSAFAKCGLWPFNPTIVLCKFPQTREETPSTPQNDTDSMPSSFNSPTKLITLRTHTRKTIREFYTLNNKQRVVKQLTKSVSVIEKYVTRTSIVQGAVHGLTTELWKTKNQKKRRKTITEELRAEEGSGTLFTTPEMVQRRRELSEERRFEADLRRHEKELKRQERARKKAEKAVEVQQRRNERAAAAEVRKKVVEEKKAAVVARKQAREALKHAETPLTRLSILPTTPPAPHLVLDPNLL